MERKIWAVFIKLFFKRFFSFLGFSLDLILTAFLSNSLFIYYAGAILAWA